MVAPSGGMWELSDGDIWRVGKVVWGKNGAGASQGSFRAARWRKALLHQDKGGRCKQGSLLSKQGLYLSSPRSSRK